MPDEAPNAGTAATINVPAAAPTNTPPPAQPAAPATQQSQAPEIDATTIIYVPDANGNPQPVMLQQLADRWRQPAPQIDQEGLKQLETWKKAVAGDQDAIRAMVDVAMPKPAAAPQPQVPADAAAIILEQNKRLEELQRKVDTALGVATKITHAEEIESIKGDLKNRATDYPYVAQHPIGAAMVQRKVKEYGQRLQQSGFPINEQTAHRVYVEVLKECEGQLRSMYAGFSQMQQPAAPANNQPPRPGMPSPANVNGAAPASTMATSQNHRMTEAEFRAKLAAKGTPA